MRAGNDSKPGRTSTSWSMATACLCCAGSGPFGQGSRVPVQMDYAALCTLKGGHVCRIQFYSDQQQALETVGL